MHAHSRRRSILGVALGILLALPLGAQTVRDSMLVSAEWLNRNIDTVRILHVGDRLGYEAGHIPGASLVEMSSLVVQRGGTPNELPSVEALEAVFRNAGAGSRGRIVVYSSDPLFAARAWFTLDYLGQGSRTSILDGGYAHWVAHACPTAKDPVVVPKRGSFEARAVPHKVVRLGTMRELVRIGDNLGADLVLIDARPPAQFLGEESGADVLRAGRIPGSVNVPAGGNFEADGTLRSIRELRAIYEDAGVTARSANIAYCRTGMQASVTYFALAYLGYDSVLYDGSYLEWSNAGERIAQWKGWTLSEKPPTAPGRLQE